MIRAAIIVSAVVFAAYAGAGFALRTAYDMPGDARQCGEPRRDASGRIVRSARVVRDFRKLYPCPATGRRTGECPGWAVDHVIPLASCGCDAVENLQWLPDSIKSASADAKDRWERHVYSCRTAPPRPTLSR